MTILKRISAYPSGSRVFSPRDFLDLGTREAVDQALSRHVKAGRLRRVGRGLYDNPRFSIVLKRPAPVDSDAVIAALARRDGTRIMVDGLAAASQLGLTNAVPAKATFVTDGHTRSLKIGGRTFRFRHAPPKVMWWAGRPAAPVVLALRWLGPMAAADRQVALILHRQLSEDVKRDLRKNRHFLPSWTLPLVHDIIN